MAYYWVEKQEHSFIENTWYEQNTWYDMIGQDPVGKSETNLCKALGGPK